MVKNIPIMTTHEAEGSRSARVLGFYAALSVSIVTMVTFVIAFFTPPQAGPLCVGSCYEYPYTDVASRFPRDYIWMVPAMLLLVAFAALMVALHHLAPKGRQVFSQIGVGFAMISVGTLLLDYFVQLSVIQPSLLLGEHDGIAMLSQYNPHGLYIALEELGYLLMSLALLCMAPALSGPTRTEAAVRWIFASSFVLNVLAFVAISVMYGLEREYRYEIAAISIDWLALIASGALLGILLRPRAVAHEGIRSRGRP